MSMTTINGWIRPWWPGRDGDHANADCALLKAETDTPTEGTGWLDPNQATKLCPSCFAWHATCTRCYASSPRSAKDQEAAQEWADEHVCPTSFDYTAAIRPLAAPEPPHGHPVLFPLSDLTRHAVEARR